jgi:hypothetical protein
MLRRFRVDRPGVATHGIHEVPDQFVAIERAWAEAAPDALTQPPEEPDVPSIEKPSYLQRAFRLLHH